MKTSFRSVVFAILRKDLQAEFRSRELFSIMLLFALISILVFSYALELDQTVREEVVSGVIWVTIAFASILGLNRSLAIEQENGTLDAVLLAPIDRSAIFVGKALGNFIFVAVVGLLLLPLITILYNIPLPVGTIILMLSLGILGFSTVGTILATITLQTRAKEALLPIVMLPFILPILLPAVSATSGMIKNTPGWESWLQVLLVVDIIYLVMSLAMYRYIVED